MADLYEADVLLWSGTLDELRRVPRLIPGADVA